DDGGAGEHQHGCRCPRAVRYEERDVHRRMARRVQHADRHIADGQVLMVGETGTIWRINRLVYEVARTNRIGKRSAAGKMIRVDVRVDDMHDAHASLPAGLLVGTDVFHGIDDDALALATAAEQVRGTDRRRMEELAKDHVDLTCVSE